MIYQGLGLTFSCNTITDIGPFTLKKNDLSELFKITKNLKKEVWKAVPAKRDLKRHGSYMEYMLHDPSGKTKEA